MKNSKRNNQGFTLLEIIVVIIILGVLASLALPRLFANVEFARSSEALNIIGVIRQSVERCGLMNNNDYSGCTIFSPDTGATLDMDDPDDDAGAHFSYAVTGDTATTYNIVATREAGAAELDPNAEADGDTITISVDTGAGTITRAGLGVYSSIQ